MAGTCSGQDCTSEKLESIVSNSRGGTDAKYTRRREANATCSHLSGSHGREERKVVSRPWKGVGSGRRGDH